MGKISKDLEAKINALNSALEKSIDSYAETVTKIKNYKLALEALL
jgi:Skp family chaperone for outer membrane proteins